LRQAYDYWQDQPGNFVVSHHPHPASTPPSRRWSVEFEWRTHTSGGSRGLPRIPLQAFRESIAQRLTSKKSKVCVYRVVARSSEGERVQPSIFGFLVSFLPTTIRTKQQRSTAQDCERGFEKVSVWCRLRLHAAKLNLRERLAARASANGLELICLPIGYAYRPFLSPSEHAMDLEGNQFVC
jgi:hypothetical protein